LLSIFLYLFIVVLSIQILYYVTIFSRFLLEKRGEINENSNSKGVSVVVCAWNEFDNLTELIPILANQKYTDFEVIIVDDRSTDGSGEYLKNEILNYPNFKLVTITETPDHVASKKYALSLGIKMATKEVLLFTDADCRPNSYNWITGMLNQLGSGRQLVLGFSPYTHEPGLLNAFIRFETFFTAWQYFSYALLGMPYMGVGRNLMYRKKLFFDKLGFRNHQKITGGDDDLFVNENANSRNTAICFHPDTHTFSEPKHNFAEWFIQKKRHLYVGKRYKQRDKLLLGFYSITHILAWLLLPVLLLLPMKLQIVVGGIFIFRILIFWIFGGIANHKLNTPIRWFALPMYDLLYAIYFATMGWYSVLTMKKIRWR
jgi:glycosyltransferase involved in cell wall biosynthesis